MRRLLAGTLASLVLVASLIVAHVAGDASPTPRDRGPNVELAATSTAGSDDLAVAEAYVEDQSELAVAYAAAVDRANTDALLAALDGNARAIAAVSTPPPTPATRSTGSSISSITPAPSSSWPSSMQPCGGDLPPCCVKARESGGDYNAQNPSGDASGAWQFLDSTWAGFGGYAKARYAPPSVQDDRARQVWAGGAGASNWYPACW